MILLNTNWSDAFTIMGLGLLIVFIVLILLVFLLIGFGKIFNKKNNQEEPDKELIGTIATSNNNALSDDNEKAAIAMALYLFYADVHDEESYVITIDDQQPSAWNSKIYNLNNLVK